MKMECDFGKHPIASGERYNFAAKGSAAITVCRRCLDKARRAGWTIIHPSLQAVREKP